MSTNTHSRTFSIFALTVSLGLGLTACDSSESDESTKKLEAAAKTALGGEAGNDKHSKARDAEKKIRQEAFAKKKAAEEKAKAENDALYAKLLALPSKMPKSVKSACKPMPEVYQEFFLRTNEGNDKVLLPFWNKRGEILGERKAACTKSGNVQVAACQIHALTNAPAENMAGRGAELMGACAQKFGGGASAAPQPKK